MKIISCNCFEKKVTKNPVLNCYNVLGVSKNMNDTFDIDIYSCEHREDIDMIYNTEELVHRGKYCPFCGKKIKVL